VPCFTILDRALAEEPYPELAIALPDGFSLETLRAISACYLPPSGSPHRAKPRTPLVARDEPARHRIQAAAFAPVRNPATDRRDA